MCKRTLSLYIQKPEPQKATKDLFLLIFSQARNGVGLKHSGTLWGVLESPSKKKQKIVSILPTRDLECIFIFVQFSKPVKFLMRYYLLVLVVLQRYFSSSSRHKCFFFFKAMEILTIYYQNFAYVFAIYWQLARLPL